VVIALVVGSVTVVTALSYWLERLGTLGIAVVGALGVAALLAIVAFLMARGIDVRVILRLSADVCDHRPFLGSG
jgi:hypothetical protein